ncbi:MAG TPA: hypothetical protein VLY46_05195, partial [Usitatibacter sp.]|nr:hypothetical protein [Usitatibacter sp.]
MAATAKVEVRKGLSGYFSASQGRVDRWRSVHRLAKALAAGSSASEALRNEALEELNSLAPLEELCAYPGPALMATLKERLQTRDWTAFARLAQRISISLLSNSYRDDPEAWKADEEGEAHTPEVLPPGIARGQARKPYFEVLVVTPGERSTWEATRESLRRLRRDSDSFIYEPVVVGSFEDAALAAIVNYNINAVVIFDGFGYPSQHAVPDLREILAAHVPAAPSTDADLGTTLARVLNAYRPELDLYLATDRDVGALAGSDEAACIRRVFYGVEEMLEIHLSILDGIAERYATPFFDNLKKYAQRPIGTFHALPVARGKSVFKSHWIRDFGYFYGTNIFLAESSATTGGLDSLLEPTGNIKIAQEKAARCFGAQKLFFATNGTSTSNKIAVQAIVRPGDIVLVDRNCHKSHHYGLVLGGGQPLYVEAYPLMQYSMYGGVPLRTIKQTLLDLKAEGKLDRVRMLLLTNCTFDGHIYNVPRFMEEVLAIKPDIVFLWDEAWYAYSRFSPFHRRRSAMGACEALRERYANPAYRAEHAAFKKKYGNLDPKNPKLLDTHLLPDPDAVKLRVYATTSTHKSLSCFRQG